LVLAAALFSGALPLLAALARALVVVLAVALRTAAEALLFGGDLAVALAAALAFGLACAFRLAAGFLLAEVWESPAVLPAALVFEEVFLLVLAAMVCLWFLTFWSLLRTADAGISKGA
jgi:hypothetical protein